MLLLALSGLLLLRLATRQLLALLFQLPPRITRFEPYGQNPTSIIDFTGGTLSFPSFSHCSQAATLDCATILLRNPSVSANRT